MIKELAISLTEAIKQNGSRSVFWAGIIEQVISPIPSPLIPMGGGVFLIPQGIAFTDALIRIMTSISLPYALGATIGSTVLFLAARLGGNFLIEKYGKFFGLSAKNAERFRNRFTRGFKDELLIFLLVTLPVTPISLVAASCGLIGIPIFEFYLLLLAGAFVRSTFLGWLGWQIGETYELIGEGLSKIESILTLIGVGGVFAILAFLYYKRQKFLKS